MPDTTFTLYLQEQTRLVKMHSEVALDALAAAQKKSRYPLQPISLFTQEKEHEPNTTQKTRRVL